MKRRNAEVGKMRRPMKRNKITEGFYGSTLLYLKFLVLWALVILADFILEFRFEFLWPFYLLLRSVYDSFKYQGLAFSVFFVCVALTSDMLCFFFIPVHWLFFAASTYVWVQYVWHTDKGICAPTIVLWMLFVYLEAAVRLRDVKHMPGHLDLCRPFAAHCIGYPVVTLGFGFKSYIGFRMRQRKQRDVSKENEFYLQLMQEALPIDTKVTAANTSITNTATTTTTNTNNLSLQESTVQNMTQVAATTTTTQQSTNQNIQTNKVHHHNNHHKDHHKERSNGHVSNGAIPNGVQKSHRKSVDKAKDADSSNHHHTHNNTTHNHNHTESALGVAAHKHTHNHSDKQQRASNGAVVGAGIEETPPPVVVEVVEPVAQAPRVVNNNNNRRKEKREADKEREAAEYLQRLEMDAKRLRHDLQSCRSSEHDLRLQVASLTTSEKVSRGELLGLSREVEDLQCKLQSCNSSKSQDRQTINSLERRMADERRARTNAETQLSMERKNRKLDEVRAAQVAAQAVRGECTDSCRQRRRELESEISNLRASQNWAEERVSSVEREKISLVEKVRDAELLIPTLNAMQEKNQHLENSLSAETRIKLDLFSALGEAKRQVEIKDSSVRAHEKEIEELKSKIAQVLAVMPNDSFGSPTPSSAMSRVRLTESPPGSTLDPNATAYTPKGALIASSEA